MDPSVASSVGLAYVFPVVTVSDGIQGLVFDCDGTLADTMPLHWQAWSLMTARYGLVFPEDRFYALGGVPTRDIVRMLAEEQGRQELDPLKLASEKEQAYLKLMPGVKPVPEVVKVAKQHLGRLPMAVATGGSRNAIPKVLAHLGILEWFEAIVTSEDVIRQKPAPDIFLEAARRIGVLPEKCLAFEDTDLGVESIRSAGMQVVDVRSLRSR